MAVEIFGREFAPQSTLDHVCVFTALGTVLALAVVGVWTIARKALSGRRDEVRP
jgi:hypothetical protein